MAKERATRDVISDESCNEMSEQEIKRDKMKSINRGVMLEL